MDATRKGAVGFFVLVAILGVFVFVTQAEAPQFEHLAVSDRWFRISERPHLVRFTGSLCRPEEKGATQIKYPRSIS
jgi:hypothetical protein